MGMCSSKPARPSTFISWKSTWGKKPCDLLQHVIYTPNKKELTTLSFDRNSNIACCMGQLLTEFERTLIPNIATFHLLKSNEECEHNDDSYANTPK